MEQFLSTLAGVGVSVFLFLIGYRQTIGARKEREFSANSDLERIVLRRIVLDNNIPQRTDLLRLINGKSIDHRVRHSDLLSVSQLLNVVYTRIVESDLIDSTRRQNILDLISPVLVRLEEIPVQENELNELKWIDRRRRITRT